MNCHGSALRFEELGEERGIGEREKEREGERVRGRGREGGREREGGRLTRAPLFGKPLFNLPTLN